MAAPARDGVCHVFAGIGAGVAAAYWATEDSSHPARAVADSLPAAGQPTLAGIDGRDVTIAWPATTTPGGRSALGDTVVRYAAPSGGAPTPATGGCADTVAGLFCTEQAAPAGTWYYAVTPRIHNWAGAEGARSAAVTVVLPTMTLTAGQIVTDLPGTVAGGTIAHFKASEAVTFHLDSPAGATLGATIATVAAGGSASGFTVDVPASTAEGVHVVVAVGAGGSQATSNSFTVDTAAPDVTIDSVSVALLGPAQASTIVYWHAGTSGSYSVRVGGASCAGGVVVASGTYTAPTQVAATVAAAALTEGANLLRACVTDTSSHTGSATTVVTLDTQGPTGGSVTYADGYSGVASVALTLVTGTDAVGGVAASGHLLQRSTTSLVAGSCTLPFGGFVTVATDPPAAHADTTVLTGNCYQYRYVVIDNAGNATTYGAAAVVRIDTTVPTFGSPALTLTAGANSYVAGTTVFYNPTPGAGFTVTAPNAGDAQSALTKVNFPAAGAGVSGGGDSTGPTYSATYAAAAGATASGPLTVTATNNALLTATTGFTLTTDAQVPTGGGLTVNGGAATSGGSSTYSASGNFTISRTDFTDAGAGLSSSTLTRAGATLAAGACGTFGSPAPIAGSPAQTGLAGGCYQYVLTGTDNVGNAASLTTVVMVDTTAPTTPSLAFTALTNADYASAASTLWIRPIAGGAFTVTASSTDAESGVQPGTAGYTFGSLNAGGGANFANTQTSNANAYTFGASAVAPSSPVTVLATNRAGTASATAGYTVAADTTAPTAPTPTVTASYYTTASVPVTVAAATDAASGVATVSVRRDQTALAAGLCGLFPGTFASTVVLSGGNDTSVSSGFCYQYRLVVTDNVGNQAASGASGIAKVDTTAPTTPTLSFGTFTNAGATGTTVYVRTSQNAGTFTVTVSSADPQSGVSSYAFPTFSTGWTSVTAGASRTYTWAGSNVSPPSGSQTVTVTNGAGLTSTVSFTVVADSTGPTLTDVVMGNGGTLGTIGPGDTITATFSEEMGASKFCPAWANGTVGTLTDLVITVDNQGGHDNISIASTSCPTLNAFTAAASLNTNANYVVTNVVATFNGTVTWNPTARTLTVVFGTLRTGGASLQSGISANKLAKWGPPAGLTDVAGNTLATSVFTSPTASGF